MWMQGSIQPLLIACAVGTATHHVETVKFQSPKPTVVRSESGNLELVMTMTPLGDQTQCAELAYEMDYRNISKSLLVNLIIQNPIPESTAYRVGSTSRGTPPRTITEVTPLYSDDGGLTWNYNPVSGGGGAPANYDASVTHVRFMMSGVLAPGAESTVGVGFTVRVAPD
jgi:hypothetical protein